MRRSLIIAAAALLLAGSAFAAGCMRPKAASNSSSLLGTWYEGRTGAPYRFVSATMLVVPHTQTGGGNAVEYRILDGDKLDIIADGSHRVSIIKSASSQAFVLEDPLSGKDQPFLRDPTKTAFVHSMEASAQLAISNFGTTTPDPTIVWLAPQPKDAGWPDWNPASIAAYGMAWDWGGVARDGTPIRISGVGDASGYSFTFNRRVPTAERLAAIDGDTGIPTTRGSAKIDVGYSAAAIRYPAGTMVYLPSGLIYSLGDGFAIGVALDKENQSFLPLTHP
ncbi:MAG: hypothetical protein WCI74_14930 [Actinomycetes bacterium]